MIDGAAIPDGGGGVTVAVGTEVAIAVPPVLAAVTWTSSWAVTSAAATTYVLAVAPVIAAQVMVHRSHW